MPVITKHNVLDIKNVVFGEGTPKICLPIVDTTKEGIIDTLDSYKDLDYDVVEIRLDFYEGLKEVVSKPELLEPYTKQAEIRGEKFSMQDTVDAVEDMLSELYTTKQNMN